MVLTEEGVRISQDLFGSGQGPVAGSWKYSNEPPSSIQGKEFLD